MGKNNFKIGCYIRVSTEEQAKNPEGSIKNQKERLKQAVEFKNLTASFGSIVDFYIDRGKSGKDTNRAELQRLLRDIDSGKINLLAVSELSRISRNIKDFAEIWDLMKSKNCGFYSLRENFDSTTASGEMVLYSIANVAQFERRQTSERVAANMKSRASRGLYNGGPVPIGYKLIQGKPGYLEVDEEAAKAIKTCFDVFLKEGTLSLAARWLNDNRYTLKKKVEGGGNKPRLAHFSTENLYRILTNKSYIGVRTYHEEGEEKEVKAVWDAIVDSEVFDLVQRTLKKNKTRKKPPAKNRYPYLLSGLVFCGNCGDVLCGKSAHGNSGKVGYYEHGWAVRRESCLTKKILDCGNFKRIGAKKLEPVVLGKIEGLFASDVMAKELYEKVKALHAKSPHQFEMDRLKQKHGSYERQLGSLVERLSELPEGVSAIPIYQHMKKLEAEKQNVLEGIEGLKIKGLGLRDEIPELKDYQSFLKKLSIFWGSANNHVTKAKTIATMVHRIDVKRNSLRIHYYVGKSHFKNQLPLLGSLDSKKNLKTGSNTLTNGGP